MLGALAIIVPAVALQLLAARLSAAPMALRVLLILVSAALGLLGYVLFVHRIERRRITELAGASSSSQLMAGFLLGGVLFSATVAILALCGALRMTGSTSAALMLRPLVLAIASGVLEELLFRGVLLRLLEEALGSWLALAVSAGLFGLLHLAAPHATWFSAIAIMLESGVLLGSAYFLTRQLWLPIGLHIGWNFSEGGVFGIAVSGHPSAGLWQAQLSGPPWLSGGAFGAEASVVAIAICLLATVLLLVLAARRGQLQPAPWNIGAAVIERRPAL